MAPPPPDVARPEVAAPAEAPDEATDEEDLEPLSPLPKGASPPKRVRKAPVAPAAAPDNCVPDRAWKTARGDDLQDLTRLAAQNGYMDEFELVEPELARKVREAAALADCAAVGRQIDGLIKRYQRPR